MKKVYEKPQVVIEEFLLSERIAACEDLKVTFTTILSCANNYEAVDQYHMAGYFSNVGDCDLLVDDGTVIGDSCYHTSAGKNVFSS